MLLCRRETLFPPPRQHRAKTHLFLARLILRSFRRLLHHIVFVATEKENVFTLLHHASSKSVLTIKHPCDNRSPWCRYQYSTLTLFI